MKVYTKGEQEPEISIVGSLHGDEPAGKKAIKKILNEEDLDYKKGVKFIIGNEKALKSDKRYIDSDLNRSFPGNPNSSKHEEKLAAKILEEVEGTKVLDLHTTHSYPKPFATIKDENDSTYKLLKATGVKNAVKFSDDNGTMTDHVNGVLVETGYQKTEQAAENAVKTIKNFLGYFNAIDYSHEEKEVETFEQTDTVEGDWEFTARNFEKVGKGEIYAQNGSKELKAEECFYPVLMSTNGYEDKLGFKAKKLSKN